MLSAEMAELLSQKIREMERSNAAESEKKGEAQKGKARAAARTKFKEVKKLVGDSDVPSSEKVQRLWDRLMAEHEDCQKLVGEIPLVMNELGTVEKSRSQSQVELNRALSVKGKLESLCRQLQQQSDALMEERRRATDLERRRRHELADEYQRAIEDVKKKMDAQAGERERLSRENEELRSSFKKFFERYDGREKEMLEQQQGREAEVIELNKQLEDMAVQYKKEATREAYAERDHQELCQGETQLRNELQVYSNKFSNFQDALSKSDKVLGQYKRQRNKMERRVQQLETENRELRTRSDKRSVALTKDRDQMVKQRDTLQERCRSLQAERQQALEAVARQGPG